MRKLPDDDSFLFFIYGCKVLFVDRHIAPVAKAQYDQRSCSATTDDRFANILRDSVFFPCIPKAAEHKEHQCQSRVEGGQNTDAEDY